MLSPRWFPPSAVLLPLLAVAATPAAAWVFGDLPSATNKFSMSGNGRYVAFESDATNLVPGDTNNTRDVFVLDTQTGSVVRASVDSSGAQATGNSLAPAINSDGTRVAFHSDATNLVPGDTNGQYDVFVRDLTAGSTTRVSVDSSGNQATGGHSFAPSLNADATVVAFQSQASNLVAGDTNGLGDIFVRNMVTGVTSRVSVSTGNVQHTGGQSSTASISADGTKVVFESAATNLVPGDTNNYLDIFLRDLTAGTTSRVSVGAAAAQANNSSLHGVLSADGTKVVFHSHASNLVAGDTNSTQDVFVHNIGAGTTTRVSLDSGGSQGDSHHTFPSINADGTAVVFESTSTNLVAGDSNAASDVFVHNLSTGNTVRASVDSAGSEGNGHSFRPSLSADGTRVAFYSLASNLVPGDSNLNPDVFVRDLTANTTSVPVTVSGFSID